MVGVPHRPLLPSLPTLDVIPRSAYIRCLEAASSILLDPVDLSFRALSGRLKFTVRRHKKILSADERPDQVG